MEEKMRFSNRFTQSSSAHGENGFLQPHSLKGLAFSSSWEGRHPSTRCCPGHLKKEKKRGKEPGRKEPGELHVSPVPKRHQDYSRQVGNACRVLL